MKPNIVQQNGANILQSIRLDLEVDGVSCRTYRRCEAYTPDEDVHNVGHGALRKALIAIGTSILANDLRCEECAANTDAAGLKYDSMLGSRAVVYLPSINLQG